MTEVALATEDELSEVVGFRLVEDAGHVLRVSQTFRKNGQGYLKANIGKFREVSQHIPLILLTDLDRVECPPSLIREWGSGHPFPEGFVFRVAVRETESWLLADREAMADFLGVALNRIPVAPDNSMDAKETLLALVRRCKNRSLKKDLLPEPGAPSKVGLGYNAVLGDFVRMRWSVDRAAAQSPSLARARLRIKQLAFRVANIR
jgi:hypothetical protein